MSSSPEPLSRGVLRTMQIIAAALVLGVLIFLGIVLYLVQVQNQGRGTAPAGADPIVTYVALGALAVMLLPALLVPRLLIRSSVERIARGTWQPSQGPAPDSDSAKLLMVYQTAMIVRMALLEGVSFLGCIAYLLEGQPLALGVAIAGVALLLLQFPTEGKVQSWLNEQLDLIEQLRLPA